MNPKTRLAKSVAQRVANRGRELRLTRNDALVAYAMDRLLHRLGRSAHAPDFFLKGGVLVANFVASPHRFTRDIDLLRRHGAARPDDLREIFRSVASVAAEDGITFIPSSIRASIARRDVDGYDGIRVTVGATLADATITVPIDIGFGDAVVPPADRVRLNGFLVDMPQAEVFAYDVGLVIAEKVETLLARFPLIEHRLKDLLDVVVLARSRSFEGPGLLASLVATFRRRSTPFDLRTLDELRDELRGRRWQEQWAVMRREKAVVIEIDLTAVLAAFDVFVRPLLVAIHHGDSPGRWSAGGPWTRESIGR